MNLFGHANPRINAALARAARPPRARDAGRLHARARGAARRAPHAARAAGAHPLLLRRQRLERDRSRAEDELPLLAQSRPAGQAPLRDAVGQLPRRDARRARGRQRRAVPRDLPAAAHGRDHRALARTPTRGRARRERGRLRPAHVRGAWRRRSARHAHEVCAVIVEPLVQCAAGMRMYDPGLPRAAARGLRPARRAPDRGRDRRGLRPHRHDVRLRAGRHLARISSACRRA